MPGYNQGITFHNKEKIMNLEQLKEKRVWVNTKNIQSPKIPDWKKPDVTKYAVDYTTAKKKAQVTGKNIGIIFKASPDLICIDLDVKRKLTSKEQNFIQTSIIDVKPADVFIKSAEVFIKPEVKSAQNAGLDAKPEVKSVQNFAQTGNMGIQTSRLDEYIAGLGKKKKEIRRFLAPFIGKTPEKVNQMIESVYTGKMNPAQEKLFNKYAGKTLTETSISGLGKHIYLQCEDKKGLERIGSKVKGIGDFYRDNGFVLMTENFIDDRREIMEVSAEDVLEDLQTEGNAEEISNKTRLWELRRLLNDLTPWPSKAIEKEYCKFEKVSVYDNRDFWIKIICSAKDFCYKFQVAEIDGLKLVDKWSRADTTGSYKDFDDVCNVWKSFDSTGWLGGGITFEMLQAYARKICADDVIAEFNAQWSLVCTTPDSRFCSLVDEQYRLCKETSFLRQNKSKWTEVPDPKNPGATKKILSAKYWMNHKDMRKYKDIRFMPMYEGEHDGYLNSWMGFTVSNGSCDCEDHLKYIREIICSGDKKLTKFIFSWIANLIQDPGCIARKQGVAIVLIGKQGAGKTLLPDMIGSLIGRAYIKPPDVDSLVRNFNSLSESALLAGVDEGIYSSLKKTRDTMKHLITTEQLQFERKGIDSHMGHSYLRFIFTSNDDEAAHAAIHVTADDRRFQIIEVSDKVALNDSYFENLHAKWKAGADAAFLRYFQNYKLDNPLRLCDLRVKTIATNEQILAGLSTRDNWVIGFAENGIDEEFILDTEEETRLKAKLPQFDGHYWIRNTVIYADYARYFDNKRSRMSMQCLAMFMRRLLGEHWEAQRRQTKERKDIKFWRIPYPDIFMKIVQKKYLGS